jgi:CRISPR system Cascade subunit CasA
MQRFNLIDEPWIPCVLVHGEERVLLGVRAVLQQAPAIRAIEDASPLVTVALHRLLLAILHRTLGPAGIPPWRAMWERHAWDLSKLDAYLDRWKPRFDLFDEAHPFYQTPGLPAEQAGSISKLLVELASGNNRTLFDHSFDDRPPSLPADVAARALVAYHAFALGGTVTRLPGEDRSAKAAPLVKAAVCLVTGRDLFETLMLNLHRYTHQDPFPEAGDMPAWERDEPTRAQDRSPAGYLDLLTWQSRRIRLFPEATDGRVVVRRVVIMKGYQLPDGFLPSKKETMVAFRRVLRPPAGGQSWVPIGFQEDRALWRDSLALLQSLAEQCARPPMLDWLYELVEAGVVSRTATLPLDFHGLSSDQAQPLLWRRDRLPVPLAYLEQGGDSALLDALGRGLTLAEQAGQALERAARHLAATLLTLGARRPDPKQVADVSNHLALGRAYWPALEPPFRRLLADLPTAASGPTTLWQTIPFRRWALAVNRAAKTAYAEGTVGLDRTSRAFRAVAQGEHSLWAELARITEPYLTEVVNVEAR